MHDGDKGAGPDFVRDPILAEHRPQALKLVDQDVRGGHVSRAFRTALAPSVTEAQGRPPTRQIRLIAALLRQGGIENRASSATTVPQQIRSHELRLFCQGAHLFPEESV
ncbi:hypothetical protein DMH04_26750 [Kibdelosporangium aridum]|uniref:Uncharacterized protein n=1 Tax=Kibdelosporangium aridum TaxID=2030 RepID=A0A428Z594_KIBAR|nr:hypothetical protein DMH04_26750 [Kibdelosporangium aridum]